MLGTKKRKLTVKVIVMSVIMSLLFTMTSFAVYLDKEARDSEERIVKADNLYDEVLDTAGEYTIDIPAGKIAYKYKHGKQALGEWKHETVILDQTEDLKAYYEKLKKRYAPEQVVEIEISSASHNENGKAQAIENTIRRTLAESDEEAGITAALCNMVQNLCDIEEFTMMASNKISKWFGSGGSEFINLFNGSVVSTI